MELNSRYQDPSGRQIIPDVAKLATIKVNLLKTDLGNLDLLKEIGNGLTYSDLCGRSVEYVVQDLRIRAINLETLIEAKEFADRPKDRYALPFLRELRNIEKKK